MCKARVQEDQPKKWQVFIKVAPGEFTALSLLQHVTKAKSIILPSYLYFVRPLWERGYFCFFFYFCFTQKKYWHRWYVSCNHWVKETHLVKNTIRQHNLSANDCICSIRWLNIYIANWQYIVTSDWYFMTNTLCQDNLELNCMVL